MAIQACLPSLFKVRSNFCHRPLCVVWKRSHSGPQFHLHDLRWRFCERPIEPHLNKITASHHYREHRGLQPCVWFPQKQPYPNYHPDLPKCDCVNDPSLCFCLPQVQKTAESVLLATQLDQRRGARRLKQSVARQWVHEWQEAGEEGRKEDCV